MAVIVYRKNPAGEIERLKIPAERLQAHLSAGYVVDRAELENSETEPEPEVEEDEVAEPSDEELLQAQLDTLTLEDLSALENGDVRRLAEAAGIDNAQNAKIKTLRDKLHALVQD